jgi:membrane protein implicated in regulation of membrane protease activity
MSFGELLTHAQIWPFSVVFLVFLAISLLEIIMVFTGAGSEFGLDLSADIEIPDTSSHSTILDWLGLGRVPFLISLAGFLLFVSVAGIFVQTLALQTVGFAMPWPITLTGCVILGVPAVRLLNHGLGRVWPRDVESSAASTETFIGHEAEVVLGPVASEEPGQIKFRDAGGTTHHAMAYSDRSDEQYRAGELVLVVGRRGAFYTVIIHPNPSRPSTAR